MKRIGSIGQKCEPRYLWTNFSQQVQSFSGKLGHHIGHHRDVSTRTCKTSDKAAPHRIANAHHYNRDGCRRILGRLDRRSRAHHNEINLHHQLLGQLRETLHLACSSTVFDRDVSSLIVAQVAKALQKNQLKRIRIGNQCQNPDPRDFLPLLRLGSKAKRQEHDAEGNTKNVFPHRFPLTPHVSPLALTSSLDPPERAPTAESSGRSASPFLD